MRLAELRAELPMYRWAAERDGMGWTYRGSRDGHTVRVYPVAMMCGPGEDDFATVWRVDDGSVSESYGAFWLRVAALEEK